MKKKLLATLLATVVTSGSLYGSDIVDTNNPTPIYQGNNNNELLPENPLGPNIPRVVVPNVYKYLPLETLFKSRELSKATKENVDAFLNDPKGYGRFLVAGTFLQRMPKCHGYTLRGKKGHILQGNTLQGNSAYFKLFSDEVVRGDKSVQKAWISDEIKSSDSIMGVFDFIYIISTSSLEEREEMLKRHLEKVKLEDRERATSPDGLDREKIKFQNFCKWVQEVFPLESFPSLSVGKLKSDQTQQFSGIPLDLDLCGLSLKYLSPSIDQFSCRSIKLEGNPHLSTLPPSIGRLADLDYVSIARCGFSSFPKVLAELPRISSMNLNRNKITSLPEVIGQLSTLKYFSINQNNLTALPEGMGNWTCMVTFEAILNNISVLPEGVKNWKSPLWIALDENPLDEASLKMLSDMKEKKPNLMIKWREN